MILIDENEVIDYEESDNEIIIDTENMLKITIKNNYSLTARRHLASNEIQVMFSIIKNLLLSYQDIKLYESWRYEKYKINGKNLIKLGMKNNVIKLFFSNDPNNYSSKKVNVEVILDLKIHEKTPYLIEVNDKLTLDLILEIIQEMLKMEMQDFMYNQKNFILKSKSKVELVHEKLIKTSKIITDIN